MKFQSWKLSQPDGALAARFQRMGVSPLTALVLAGRGYETEEDVRQFLRKDEGLLHNSMQMRGMQSAVARIRQALARKERICVYGDYDVDGITSTCLLTAYLRSEGGSVLPYVPNRLKEGYSLNKAALERLKEQGVSLIVTVDCGITNLNEAAYAAQLGLDLVVTDHHECLPRLPRCCAVVNPHQPMCPYPNKELAGVGVALKLVMALGGQERQQALFREYADLAAIGTVADVMELTGENRAIVSLGLEHLQTTRRKGLAALLREAGLEGKRLTATTVSFSLAPRLNAAGRMGCPNLAVELLLTEDEQEAALLARELCELNRQRQAVEMDIFNHCIAQLSQHTAPPEGAIILAGEHWHQGVVGIVASRLVERYHLPVFMICIEDGRGKGSCRSAGGVNLFEALEKCADLLDTFGGHEQAAGFTLPEENLPAFRRRILEMMEEAPQDEDGERQLLVDGVIPDARLLTLENVAALEELEPFGSGNPKPTFLLEGACVTGVFGIGGGKHTRVQFARDGVQLSAIFFSTTPQEANLRVGAVKDVAFYPQVNEFRGVRSVQLVLTDLRRSCTPEQRELQLYRRFHSGRTLTRREAEYLLPQRQDFVVVWRLICKECGQAPLEDQAGEFLLRLTRKQGPQAQMSRTLLCLEVFRERGLIDLRVKEEHLYIALRPVAEKVDLESSEVMKRLRRNLK